MIVVQENQASLAHCNTSAENNEDVQLSYRQKRRIQQAKRAETITGYCKRGPSRGLKSRRWREKHPTEKPCVKMSDSMRRAIGDRAAEFVSDCSRWVREYCTLKTSNWRTMDTECKERLYSKILGEWDLPRYIDGTNVKEALSTQCAALYRNWRYRLKEKYYSGYSNVAAKANKPAEIDANQWNWLIDHYWNDPKNKVNELSNIPQGSQQEGQEGCEYDPSTQDDDEPLYVKLYERTHRHITTGLDPEAISNIQSLKDLLQKEMHENGVDNLTPKDAYTRVFKHSSGYIRGLGFGPKLSKRVVQTSEAREEIQQMRQAYAERESALQDEIQKLKQEMNDMDAKLKQELMAEMARIMHGSS